MGRWRRWLTLVSVVFVIQVLSVSAAGALGPKDVLILVNQNSPTSRYIAKLYREYYPAINDSQVLLLSGLTDCSGPASTAADEILTRGDYDTSIAEPVRQYFLADPNRIIQIKVIITTAGMPYRIEDDSDPGLIFPGGSGLYSTAETQLLTAASVESELTAVFQSDPAGSDAMPIINRMINPYQGYHSGIDNFPREELLSNLLGMRWRLLFPENINHNRQYFEGLWNGPANHGMKGRLFSGGDMFLTCRLDGPKRQGESAVFAVRALLERASRASDIGLGIDPAVSVCVFDDRGGTQVSNANRIFNVEQGFLFNIYDPNTPQPPDTTLIEFRDDYDSGFEVMTSVVPNPGVLNSAIMSSGHDLMVILDKRAAHRTSQADLQVGEGIIALSGFGQNGDEGGTSQYLLTAGPAGGALFDVVNGAVFTSIESFNAVTMFSDVTTQSVAQGKMIDFITIGGCGAIGHAFEPLVDASIDNEFFFYNLLADADGDMRADLTFVEAAFTGLPYLSWSEVVLGDPLMRIAYGPGDGLAWLCMPGDADVDGDVDLYDLWRIKAHLGGELDNNDAGIFEKYCDLCDVNQDGKIDLGDFWIAKDYLGGVLN